MDEENKLNFTGTLTVLQRLNPYEFAVEIMMMREGINRNQWDYRNLEQFYQTFVGQPILCAFVNGKIGDGHNMREKVNRETGERYYSFTDATSERIVGTLSNDKEDFSIKEIDGEKWLVAKGRLWEFYAPELVDKIIRTGRMDVSVETMVEDSHKDGDVEVFTAWTGLGVTILGDDVLPAIPNASIKALQMLQDEFAEAKLKAASYEQPEEQQAENEEPQEQTKQGEKSMTVLNQREINSLQQTFFKDYKVLSAAHDKEKGEKLVVLMSKDGATYQYILGDAETTIQPERIVQINVCASVDFDGRSVAVEPDSMMESIAKEYATLSEQHEKLVADAKKVEDELETMKKCEKNRRIKAAKKAASDTLNAYNATSEVKVSESVLTKLNEDIDKGEYTECEDEEGEWCGEEVVSDKVLAECAKATQKANDEKAKRERTHMAWNTASDNNNEHLSGIEALLARNNIPRAE